MNIKRATALALSLSLLLGAAACGKSGSEAADTGSKTSAQLLEEENAILPIFRSCGIRFSPPWTNPLPQRRKTTAMSC